MKVVLIALILAVTAAGAVAGYHALARVERAHQEV